MPDVLLIMQDIELMGIPNSNDAIVNEGYSFTKQPSRDSHRILQSVFDAYFVTGLLQFPV